MNYSENTRKRQNAIKRQRWFRRMFTVALLMGILIGFVLGRISATAFEDKPTTAPEPTETAFVISTPEPGESGSGNPGTCSVGYIQDHRLLFL